MSAGRRFHLALAPLLRAGNAARVSRLASIALAIGAKPVLLSCGCVLLYT